ncbi:MAG: hypothetical protein IJB89_07725 [Akkermansia sp.]|nr:hypothetical protein [Akkermansia sp.]
MFDDIVDLIRILFYLLAFIFFMMAMPFVLLHVAEHWNEAEYPHSGFSPECPEYIEPEESNLATRQ